MKRDAGKNCSWNTVFSISPIWYKIKMSWKNLDMIMDESSIYEIIIGTTAYYYTQISRETVAYNSNHDVKVSTNSKISSKMRASLKLKWLGPPFTNIRTFQFATIFRLFISASTAFSSIWRNSICSKNAPFCIAKPVLLWIAKLDVGIVEFMTQTVSFLYDIRKGVGVYTKTRRAFRFQ